MFRMFSLACLEAGLSGLGFRTASVLIWGRMGSGGCWNGESTN